MASVLSCPFCLASFTLDEWSRKGACPECARRLSFFEAAGQAVPRPADDMAAVVASAAAHSALIRREETGRTLGGKPLRWTRGWSAVVLIWVLCAAVLGVVRMDTGHWRSVAYAEDTAAVTMYAAMLPGTDLSNETAMAIAVSRLQDERLVTGAPHASLWVRSRLDGDGVTVFVYFEWDDGHSFALLWTVRGTEASPDPATLRFLQAAVTPGGSLGWPDPPSTD